MDRLVLNNFNYRRVHIRTRQQQIFNKESASFMRIIFTKRLKLFQKLKKTQNSNVV